VLKPFVQSTFDFDALPDTFLAKLVPTQARAIVRARFMCDFGLCLRLTKGARSHLKGLKHVEIHVGIHILRVFPIDKLNEVEAFFRGPTFVWLSEISLESLRFVAGTEGVGSTEDLRTSILKLMQRREDEMLSK
jgi:hypothetical protein